MAGSITNLPGIGIDIVHVPRILKVISSSEARLSQFVSRIMTQGEQQSFWQKWGRAETILGDKRNTKQCATHLAGRWAAKEAVIKAATPRRVYMSNIEIGTHGLGFRYATITHDLFPNAKTDFGKISISHDGEYATAICLALGT